MILNRRDFLQVLEACAPGTSNKENIDQSNCFLFRDGRVMTYNDEVCCIHEYETGIEAAVPAKLLLDYLRNSPDEELNITSTDAELLIKGAGRRSKIKLSTTVSMIVDVFDQPVNWIDVPPAFGDAIGVVADCASEDKNEEVLGCIRFTKDYMEACDRYQAIRYHITTGFEHEVLVRKTSCTPVGNMGIAAVAVDDNWVHWKTFSGLQYSVRKIMGNYPSLDPIFNRDVITRALLPGSVVDIIARAKPFMEESKAGRTVDVFLKTGKLMVKATKADGIYEELRDVPYSGPGLMFRVQPKHIEALLKHGLPCAISNSTLQIDGDGFSHVISYMDT